MLCSHHKKEMLIMRGDGGINAMVVIISYSINVSNQHAVDLNLHNVNYMSVKLGGKRTRNMPKGKMENY